MSQGNTPEFEAMQLREEDAAKRDADATRRREIEDNSRLALIIAGVHFGWMRSQAGKSLEYTIAEEKKNLHVHDPQNPTEKSPV